MTELLALFERRLTASGLRSRLAEAEQISRAIFDFRQGGERWEARKTLFSARTTEVADAVIARICRDPQHLPAELGEPTHALVLGGRIHSCLLRAELLADLLGRGLRVGHIWGLGSHREVVDMERDVAAELFLGPVTDELGAMCAALRHALNLPHGGNDSRRLPREVRRLATSPIPVSGLAAEPAPGNVRATTSDTYRYFLETAGNVTAQDHLLIITSAIDAPFQHAQALCELSIPTGATITSAGAHIGTSRMAAVRTEWTTAEWLQEIRSAIWSMRMMYEKLLAAHPGLDHP